MKHRQSIIFNRLILNKKLNIEELVNKLSQHMYIDEKGIGLTSIHVDEDLLICTVLSKTPSTIQSYNESQGILENTIIQIFEEVVVIWDIENQLLYTLSSASKFSKAKQLISDCLTPNFSFGNIEFLQIGLIEKLRNSNYKIQITDLHIKKFHYQPEAYGRFCVHIENNEIGEELYSKYSNNLSKVSLTLEDNYNSDNDFRMSISPRNSMTIECQDAQFDSIVKFIKEKLQ